LKTDKDLPLKARLAMAYCYFNLNKFDMAELCFKRVLKIDESCVEALIGLAIISERNEEYQNYFEYLEAAKDISNNHPLVLLHLAEHYLMLKDTSRVKSLARKGLKAIKGMARIHDCSEQYRNDYYEYEGRFQNLLGQSYHIEGNFRKALF
jgi:tetratricopeptide (TPR) repeat protein